MRAMIIATNPNRTRFFAEVENNTHLLFETREPIHLLRGNQVKGEFDQLGQTALVTSGGVVFEASIVEAKSSMAENQEWVFGAST